MFVVNENNIDFFSIDSLLIVGWTLVKVTNEFQLILNQTKNLDNWNVRISFSNDVAAFSENEFKLFSIDDYLLFWKSFQMMMMMIMKEKRI